MIYQFKYQTIYQKNIPASKLLYVTAMTAARWCRYYEINLLYPREDIPAVIEKGRLPRKKKAKELFVQQLLDWMYQNSAIESRFGFSLDEKPIGQVRQEKQMAKFDYNGDTSRWFLNLGEEELKELKAAWISNQFPEDFFLPDPA